MIGDVGSTNDFFIKPESRQKRGQEVGPAESSPIESTAKSDKKESKVALQTKTPVVHKSEFAKKLKSLNGEESPKSKQGDETVSKVNDHFSPEAKSSKGVEPIRTHGRRNESFEEQTSEIESLSDPDSDRFSFKSGGRSTIDAAAPKKAGLGSNEESIDSTLPEDSSARDVDVEPNMQLMAMLASPQFNVKDLSPSELKEVKEALRDQQAELKQVSVQKFMNQLQTQFGITPEKVVKAFAQMDEKTLTAPPSESISKFVNNLNVKDPARQQIANLYKQMLNETGEAALNEKLLGAEDDSKSVSLKVMDSTQSKLAELNKSLDNLNDNFFRKGQFQPQTNQQIPPSIKEQLKKLTQANSSEETNSKSSNGLEAMLAKLGGEASGLAAAVSSEEAVATPLANGPALATAAAPPAMMDMSAYAQNQPQNFDQGNGAQDNQRGTKEYATQNAQAANQSTKNFTESTKLNIKSEGTQAKPSASSAASSTVGAVAGAAVATASVAGTTAAALNPQQMMMTGPSKQDAAENVQEVIKQAQVIIKKGGGEMNVEMKPEGMGQVHLKVALENGQVSIQMMAQNDKVKKLLEEGIHELKGNLAAHKLQVESLKIGIASGIADKKMEQQQGETQREALREAQRNMAGNFAGEMRDQRNDRNSAFGEMRGMRNYRNEPKRVSVEAGPEEMNFNRRDESRRLSVFA